MAKAPRALAATGRLMRVGEDESLRRSVIYYQGDDRCMCDYAWRSLGRLYGVSFGHGWVRLTTEEGCAHHGTRLPGHGER